jgi:peroxiredoxin
MQVGRLLIAALVAAAVAGGAVAQEPEAFPAFRGKDLTGETVSTEQFRGKVWLVVAGFDKSHARTMEQWAVAFKQTFPDETKADFFHIAAFPGQVSIIRRYFEYQIGRGISDAGRKHVMTVYAADAFAKKLEIQDRDSAHVFVVDAAGKIVHRESGEFREEAFNRVRQAVTLAGGR